MAHLLYAKDLSKSYGVKPLFHNLTFGVSDKDRIGILGPNGSGKTTFLKILAGLEQPDGGSVVRQQNLRVSFIPQHQDFHPESTAREVVGEVASTLGVGAQEQEAQVKEILGRTGFENPDQVVGPLSGGWRKRLMIACGLVQTPDVMLLDEPTNHLDFEGLQWLEQIMGRAPWPWVMVTHDRWFMERVTNQVAELNSRYADGLLSISGTYTQFLEKREAYLTHQQHRTQALAGKVRREEEWLRRGPKARTGKARYRVEAAEALQQEFGRVKAQSRDQQTDVDFVGTGRKTKQLLALDRVTKAFEGHTLFQDLTCCIGPGNKLGILGQNGSGKTTLLKLLSKETAPDQGTIHHADDLRIVYFDQQREQLDHQQTLRRLLSDTGHTVVYREQSMHVAGWAKRFGFQPEHLDLPVSRLSGGEQARAIIARLMVQPADVLIVDEPTNDLDIPTREVLEESLREFPGGVILVTHDRYMLETVCRQFIGLDGTGKWGEFAEFEQWKTWVHRQGVSEESKKGNAGSVALERPRAQSKKLSYQEQREYDNLEQRLIEAEMLVDQWRKQAEDPAIATDHAKLQDAYEGLQTAQHEVERLYARWDELETKVREMKK